MTIDLRYNEARVRTPYLLPLVFVYFCINESLHDRHRILNKSKRLRSRVYRSGQWCNRVLGIIGAIWVVALWIMLMRQAYYMYKRKQEYHYFLYFLFETGNMYIGMQWSCCYPLPFFVLVALLNYEFSSTNISTREEARLVLK